MNILKLLLSSSIALISLNLPQARAAGDAGTGGDVFDTYCAECHSVKADKVKKGPSLFGIFGRTSGSVAGFDYSDSMRQAKLLWDDSKLEAYVAAPKKVIPDGKMKFDGIEDAQERADLIAFLHEQK